MLLPRLSSATTATPSPKKPTDSPSLMVHKSFVQPLLSVPPRGTLVSRLCDSSYLVTYVELEP